ncbi:hypothetical protein ACRAWD_13995 [Caulobacter segnis]
MKYVAPHPDRVGLRLGRRRAALAAPNTAQFSNFVYSGSDPSRTP